MRKLVWFGAALMVAGAVAVYIAANYAVKHPESYLGRCAAAAVYVGARSNPVTLAAEMACRGTPAVGQAGAAMVCGALGMADGVAQPEQAAGVKPVPACVPEDQADIREAAEAAETVEPIKPEVLPQEPVATPDQERAEGVFADSQMVPFTIPVVPVESEEPDSGTTAAGRITISEESGTTEAPEAIAVPTAETIAEEIPAPAEEEDATDEGCHACPCKPCEANGCASPCCCWLMRLMKGAGLVQDMGTDAHFEVIIETTTSETPATEQAANEEAAAEECEALPMPAECAEGDDEPQEEVLEETCEEIPTCPTSSYDHYHHGGCPYMGGSCPYYRGTPVITPVETPKKSRSRKKTKQPTPEKSTSLNRLWKKMASVSADEETQEQTGIDTMEFRPSDDPREPPGSSPF